MELKIAFEDMNTTLNELNEQFNSIKKNDVRVPQIEIDIIMSTMRRLYESMNRLNKQPFSTLSDVVIEEEKPLAEEVLEVKVVVEGSNVADSPEKIEDGEVYLEKKVDQLEEIAFDEVTNAFLVEVETMEQANDENTSSKESEKETGESTPKESLLLQFEDEVFTVNENVAQKGEDKSVVTKLSNKRIENLKSAIGINDKFYFINELFSGDSQAYEDVIYTLNNFKRFEEAMQYVGTLKYRYDWNIEAEAYQKLVHFLERKFMEIHA